MNSCPLSNLCYCSATQICLFCKILTVICIFIAGGVIGYAAGKKKKDKRE